MIIFWGKKLKEVHILPFFTLFDTNINKLCIILKIQIYSFLIFKHLIHVTMQVPIYTFEFWILFGLCA